MAKKTTKKRAEERALKAMSDYIRERDRWTCISCGKYEPDKRKMHDGHLFSRRFQFIKFDERNNNAQCAYCNIHLSGNIHEYIKAFKEKYGEKAYNELDGTKNTTIKRNVQDYLDIEKYFKDKLAKLKNKKW